MDTIEESFEEWKRTREVLEMLKEKYEDKRLIFVCSTDKLKEFNRLWQKEDVEYIVNNFGLVIIDREDKDALKTFYKNFNITGDIY